MFLSPVDSRWIAAGFITYRVFDIWETFPVGWVEDKLGPGAGIMANDFIAGLYTLLVLQAASLIIANVGN